MAKRGVLVRHLNAIENLGSMDILCTDKTGTLTEGVVHVEGAYAPSGHGSDEVSSAAFVRLNGRLPKNPLCALSGDGWALSTTT